MSLTQSTHAVSLLKNLEKNRCKRQKHVRIARGERWEQGKRGSPFLPFFMFSFLLRRRASPPRPRTNAEKRLGTEDYSLKGKAKAFFKLDQWMSRIPHYFYSVNFIYASKKVLVCLIRDLQNQYHHMYNICWNVFCKTNLYVNRRHPELHSILGNLWAVS